MLNSTRTQTESAERSRKPAAKTLHTTSINLKQQESCTDTFYLPLRETVNKRIDNYAHNYRKIMERSHGEKVARGGDHRGERGEK